MFSLQHTYKFILIALLPTLVTPSLSAAEETGRKYVYLKDNITNKAYEFYYEENKLTESLHEIVKNTFEKESIAKDKYGYALTKEKYFLYANEKLCYEQEAIEQAIKAKAITERKNNSGIFVNVDANEQNTLPLYLVIAPTEENIKKAENNNHEKIEECLKENINPNAEVIKAKQKEIKQKVQAITELEMTLNKLKLDHDKYHACHQFILHAFGKGVFAVKEIHGDLNNYLTMIDEQAKNQESDESFRNSIRSKIKAEHKEKSIIKKVDIEKYKDELEKSYNEYEEKKEAIETSKEELKKLSNELTDLAQKNQVDDSVYEKLANAQLQEYLAQEIKQELSVVKSDDENSNAQYPKNPQEKQNNTQNINDNLSDEEALKRAIEASQAEKSNQEDSDLLIQSIMVFTQEQAQEAEVQEPEDIKENQESVEEEELEPSNSNTGDASKNKNDENTSKDPKDERDSSKKASESTNSSTQASKLDSESKADSAKKKLNDNPANTAQDTQSTKATCVNEEDTKQVKKEDGPNYYFMIRNVTGGIVIAVGLLYYVVYAVQKPKKHPRRLSKKTKTRTYRSKRKSRY
ncbi:MAG: hypothetical protein AAF380_03125 [Bacteroidota bacterium]